MMDYDDPNIFRSDGNFNVSDTSSDNTVQIRCPHCHSMGTFQTAVRRHIRYSKTIKNSSKSISYPVEAHIRFCPNSECKSIVFTITQYHNKDVDTISFPPELLDFNAENLPDELTHTLNEAIICHSQGAYRASAMMVRRLLEELCHDCGAEGKSLYTRLKSLRTQITLPEELFDAMDELKALGNDAAHIEAKAFATIDREESQLSIELAQEILKARYQHRNLVDRLKARKKTS